MNATTKKETSKDAENDNATPTINKTACCGAE
jgi:hypothetical protein